MRHPLPPQAVRGARIFASTIFALTLALLAGLIGAYVFKTYVMNGKNGTSPTLVADAPRFELTVAAVNILDNTQIQSGMVKTVTVSKEVYDKATELQQARGEYLRGTQPVNRVTKRPIRAEESFYENYLEVMEYPKPVSELLKAGMRAVIIEVPARSAMVQVGDVVDVLCTLANDAFGPGGTGTSVIAKDARVVARFNTTQKGARPVPGEQTRTYTVEVKPYKHQMIELAKSLGASFTLSVSARTKEAGNGLVDMGAADEDPQVDKVTTADLAKLFGVSQLPPPEAPGEIERWVGVDRVDSIAYDRQKATAADKRPAPGKSAAPPANPRPPSGFAPPNGTTPPRTGRGSQPTTGPTSFLSAPAFGGTLVASADPASERNFGFRAPSFGGIKKCGG